MKLRLFGIITVVLLVTAFIGFLFYVINYCEVNKTNPFNYFSEEYKSRQLVIEEQEKYMEIVHSYRMLVGRVKINESNNEVTNEVLKPYFEPFKTANNHCINEELVCLFYQGKFAYKRLVANVYAYNLKFGFSTPKEWLNVDYYNPYLDYKPFYYNDNPWLGDLGFKSDALFMNSYSPEGDLIKLMTM